MKNIKNEALQNLIDKGRYYSHNRKILWQSKKTAWNWIAISWGLRDSDIRQYFPIWNSSDNSQRSLMFGFGFWYFEFIYHKAGQTFQYKWYGKYLPFRKKLWRFYNLIL